MEVLLVLAILECKTLRQGFKNEFSKENISVK